MDALAIALALIGVTLVATWIYLTRTRGHLETLGLPIDKPFLMFGSPPHFMHKTKHTEHMDKFKKFNSLTYCKYEGRTPILVSMDPEIVKSVLIKNFDSFGMIMGPDIKLTEKQLTLDVMHGNIWKNTRKHLSPTFTSGKLKAMMEPIAAEVDKMVQMFEETVADKEAANLTPLIEGALLNIIGQCGFGVDLDALHNDSKHPITVACDELIKGFVPSSYIESIMFSLLFAYFPFMMKLISLFPAAYDKLWECANAILQEREKTGYVGKDFLGRLMEMRKDLAKNPDSKDNEGLTQGIITSQGSIFLVAGFSGASYNLEKFFYAMATHPEEQDRIRAEVLEVMDNHGGVVNSDTVGDMTYLEAALEETLRRYTMSILQARYCTKDCEVVPGIVIKKGQRVDMPINASHMNPDFFPEPEKFKPERFLKENAQDIIPNTYRPFGGGPRMCIGNRFAMTEMKIIAAKMLAKFYVVATPETKYDIKEGSYFMVITEPIKVKLETRH